MLFYQNVVSSLFICWLSFLTYSKSVNSRDCVNGKEFWSTNVSDCLLCPLQLQSCDNQSIEDRNHCVRSCAILLPSHGNLFFVAPGTANVEISWTLGDVINATTIRRWYFSSFGKKELLGQIFGSGTVMKDLNSSLPVFEIEKPATLVLKNVDDRYNGTYEFSRIENDRNVSFVSSVTVLVTAEPVVTELTSKPEKAVVGQSVTMICETRARPPPRYAIFHNNTRVYHGTKNTYTIQKVENTHAGLYECIIENEVGSSSKTYMLTVLESRSSTTTLQPIHANTTRKISSTTKKENETEKGSSTTNLPPVQPKTTKKTSPTTKKENQTGEGSTKSTLSPVPPKTTKKISPTTKKEKETDKETAKETNGSNNGIKWYIYLVIVVAGIMIIVLLLLIVWYFKRRSKSRKYETTSEQQTYKEDNQDLVLSKLNSEDDN